MTVCILLPEQYNLLWKTSWLTLSSAVYLFHRAHYDLCLIATCVFLTSINYWRRPDYSWRRYADLGAVFVGTTYESIRARNAEHRVAFFTLNTIAVASFLVAIHLYNQKRWWASTLWHANIHLTANAALLIVASGRLE
jgi:hypothetical protein